MEQEETKTTAAAGAAVDGAVYCLICVVKLALIITAPVWALPYAIWRKGRK